MTRKSSKHCMWCTEPLDCCFDFIRSHQLCILWSFPLEIKPATTFAGSISSGEDHGIYCWWDLIRFDHIHCWWDLIRLKQQSSGFICNAQCLLEFMIMVIQFIFNLSINSESISNSKKLIHLDQPPKYF